MSDLAGAGIFLIGMALPGFVAPAVGRRLKGRLKARWDWWWA